MPLLTVKNLHIATATTPLVEGLSFSLNKGETLAVVGESGSGKTLTALAVMGLLAEGLTPCADAMEFNGIDLLHMSPKARRSLRGKQMAMIFQEPATALNPVLTCGYQVEEAFIIHANLTRKQRYAKVIELFEKVKLPEPERIFRSYPHQLSGGQRQRVMIAMALAHKPDVLIADEPTTALDVTVQAEILKLVKDLQRDMGMAMLWITHDFGVVEKIADRVLVLQHGKLVEEGTLAHVLKKPKQRYTKQLLAATLTLNPLQRKHADKKPQPVVQAQNLGLTYREAGFLFLKPATEFTALQGASFTLAKGRTLGVVGESGSGKSTLARVLTRLAEPDNSAAAQRAAVPAKSSNPAGTLALPSITLLGQNFLSLKGEPLRKARKNLQMVFQDPSAALNPKMKIGDAVAEGIRAHNLMPEKQIAPYVQKLLESCGLPADSASRYPHQFSGGQKQRICIARALALQPDVVICDEAVSALDVSVQAQILALLQSIQKERGTSFIFISHDLRVVSHLADDVLVMHKGRVVESGPTAQVFTKPKHAYTKKLLSAVI